MSAPQPPSLPPSPQDDAKLVDLQRKASIALLFACPVIMALPPRKLDFYTFGLGAMWLWSANRVTLNQSGRSILQHLGDRQPSFLSSNVPPEKPEEVRERLAREGLLRAQPSGQGSERKENMGFMGRTWLGDEKEGWRKKRLEEDRLALQEGKGYADLIMEQIREVWTGEKTKKEGEKRSDVGQADIGVRAGSVGGLTEDSKPSDEKKSR
ncbi:MAG: 40S ribosomal protein S4 [Watsoniomyces obsoletus]|nr:MAG: 40S ribosomal protein S4 [Watsoniomyces obsoletus]